MDAPDTWQRCDTHGAIDGSVAWGCPECVRELRGAMDADDARLRAAAARSGLEFGCDTPEHMADTIKELRADVDRFLDENEELQRERDGLRQALRSAEAFIAVMFGQGPEAVIPEMVVGHIGVPINLGAIMRDIGVALSAETKECTC